MTHPLAELHATPQWVLVKLVPKPGGTDKIPLDYRDGAAMPRGSGGHLAATYQTTHASASAAAARCGPGHTVGFVITAADPWWCLDIDGALGPAGWSPLSQTLIQSLPGSVVEVSQSGRGLHIWGRGPVPEHAKKNTALGIELYTEARFIAEGLPGSAVGQLAPECPAIAAVAAAYFPPRAAGSASLPATGPRADWRGPADDDDLIRRASAARSASATFSDRATFSDLWVGDQPALARTYPSSSGKPYDASSADAALASHLAFWTGCDAARCLALMLRSGLRREKWEQRPDYLEETVQWACQNQQAVCQDKPPEPLASAAGAAAAGMAPVTGNTFLGPAEQAALFANCVYIQDMHRALVPGGALVKPDQFRARYGGYTFAMDLRNERTSRNAWEAFTESQALRAPRADTVCFKPALPFGHILTDGGRSRANTYSAPIVARRAGDAGPFLKHLALLVPDEHERKVVFYTLCALVQRQGYKAQWALVLQGVEGNGKTFLLRCVAKAIGEKHVYWPRADKIAAGFNGWLRGHTLFLVEEIMVGDRQDLIDILKPYITADGGIEIELKGVDQVSDEICGNFMFTTNHRHALRKTRNDRRFAIIYTAQQAVEDLARDGMAGQYMNELYRWAKLEHGFEIVSALLWSTPIPPEFDFSAGMQRAPITRSTEAAIVESRGGVEQEIADAVERGEIGFRGGWVSSFYLDKLLQKIGRDKALPINRRREVLQNMGYCWHPALPLGRVNNIVLPEGIKSKLFVQSARSDLMALPAAAAAERYTRDQGLAA